MKHSPQPDDDLTSPWRIALVGAGPGDPGLLTLRGAEILGQCDVVLYDGLSNQDLLQHAPQAQHVSVGKHGQSRIWKQPEIIDEILQHARAGRRVVRLKGGDPAVFARTSEEVDAIREAGFSFEIVPGITAALAAGSFAGIPITHRGLASAVALVTGHEEPDKSESDLDWNALARFPGTLVIYMGVTTAHRWTNELIKNGKPSDTPVAIVRRCSLPDQKVVHCTLGDVAQHLTPASKMRPPVITIVGDVTRLSEAMSWFDRRSMFGKTVLNTRPADPDCELTSVLQGSGAEVLSAPAIQINALTEFSKLDAAIDRLSEEPPEVLAFCSVNGVRHFFGRVFARGRDVRVAANCRLAAVGKKTADELHAHHLQVDWIPDRFTGEALAERLIDEHVQSCMVVRASRGSNAWVDGLQQSGTAVAQVIAYNNEDVPEWDPRVHAAINDNRVDWVTVTSSAAAANFVRLVGGADFVASRSWKVASLSPVTTRALQSLGVQVDAEAKHATMKSLADAILESEVKQTPHQEMIR